MGNSKRANNLNVDTVARRCTPTKPIFKCVPSYFAYVIRIFLFFIFLHTHVVQQLITLQLENAFPFTLLIYFAVYLEVKTYTA